MVVISFAKPSTLNLLLFLTYYYVLLLLALLPFCRSRDTITVGTIVDPGGETLVSAGEIFELGFFTMKGNFGSRRYVGIWYRKSENRTFVWVANRNAPILHPNTRASLAIVGGNLMIRDNERSPPIWSTGVDGSSNSSRSVKLLDSGNLVLSEENGRLLWQSFDHPTDTFLPGMSMRPNFTLTSWARADDPKSGKYTFQLDQGGTNKYEVRNGTNILWESGVSGNFIPEDLSVISNFLVNSTKMQQPSYASFASRNENNSRLVMSLDGQVEFFKQDKIGMWALVWSEPRDKCSVFKPCGNYGICNSSSNNTSMCTCLQGFVPWDRKSWDSGVFIRGCISNKGSACEMTDEKAQNFSLLKVVKIKAPDSQNPNNSEERCRNACLGDCHCQAYSFEKPETRSDNSICWTWSDDTILSNIEVLPLASSNSVESRDIYVRVPSSATDVPGNVVPQRGPLTKKEKKKPLFLIALAGTVIIIITVGSVFYARRKQGRKQGNRENIRENLEFHLYDSEKRIKQWMDSQQFEEDDKTVIDVPFVDLDIILEATNNFSEENKLGRGGFGPVYKATFPGGQEIAVKRLLSGSGQGLVEFKNEVVLIAKLQHRNLVRLVGYCMRGDEKMLLYEYMPNKSLDAFIFDRTRSMLLTWDVRFEIILGIARGMLYLHQDSRLRIIHRDLKTSNILLDEEMNPKISDFGLARIFEAKQTEASTQRIMGTYGYMSPEYALDGFFSFKSDVFSFGVVMLEIISGRRNTGFYQTDGTLSLLTYVWKLWKDNNALNLVDPTMKESFNRNQVLTSINVALLCVQDDPTDRPTMSTVVFMLGSESASLPNPKEPAFAVKRSIYGSVSSSRRPESSLELSSTLEQGR